MQEAPGAVVHGAKTGVNNIIEGGEKSINYIRSLRLDPAGGSKQSEEDMQAMRDHVNNGGTECNAGEVRRSIAVSPFTTDPDAPKTSLPRLDAGEAPRTTGGKVLSGAAEIAVEGMAAGAALAPVKTAKNLGNLGKATLESTGLKPATAQAAMYKARDASLGDFVKRSAGEAGDIKQSWFSIQSQKGTLGEKEIQLRSDTVRHIKKRHPDMTEGTSIKYNIFGKELMRKI